MVNFAVPLKEKEKKGAENKRKNRESPIKRPLVKR
jgi:hypothetical protein